MQQCLYMCKKCLCVYLCAIGSFSLGYWPQLVPGRAEAICILLCQKNPDVQMSSGAGKVTGLQLHVQVEVNTAAV